MRPLDAAGSQTDEGETPDEQTSDQLATDVGANDGFQVQHDAGQAEVVRAGDKCIEPSPQAIAIDHHVHGEEHGAQPVGGDSKDTQRVGKGRHTDRVAGGVIPEVAQPVREGRAQVVVGELFSQSRTETWFALQQGCRLGRDGGCPLERQARRHEH